MTRLKWKYVWPYLVFIASIGTLVLLNASVIESSISSSQHFAQTINLAGRQRMLSQRLVTYVLLPDSINSKSFSDDLALWGRIHHSLQSGDEKYSLQKLNYTEIQQLFTRLNPVQEKLHRELSAIRTRQADTALTYRIINDQQAYLAIMDNVVKAYEAEAVHSYMEVRNKQVWIAGISGLVLILEILILIIPYHRKLILAFRQLKEQKIKLEEQNEEIEQQNNKLQEQNTELDKLHRTEELTLNGINAGVWNWYIDSGMEEWSDRFYTLLGYEPGQIPATFDVFLNRLLHPDDIAPVQAAIEAHLQHGRQYCFNIRMQLKDGSYKWFETSGQAARDASGNPIQMAGSIIDVHEKVKNRQQLELLNHTKDRLFTIIAHDLRAPLASLRSLLDVQESDIIAHDEFMDYLHIVKDNTATLSQSLDNLLHWASGQMQGFSRHIQLVDISEIVQTICDFYKPGAAQKQISLEADAAKGHFIRADKDHMLLIVRNVVNNAIKFTHAGGKISLCVTNAGNEEQVTITDTGIGMEQEQIQDILNGTIRQSGTGTHREKGLGLGLSLSVDMIWENNGRLEIRSEPGNGSCFILKFPKAVIPAADA